jgi:hypothetical protein
MPNTILNSVFIRSVQNGTKRVAVKFATETDTWNRPFLAQSVMDDFSKAIEKADIPAEATTAILA